MHLYKTWHILNFTSIHRSMACLLHITTINIICELKFCEPGGCFSSKKLKMSWARNLKALLIFWVNRWKICCVFNYCTEIQAIWFSLSPLTIHANLHFFLKISYLHASNNLHMSAICKLGKSINKCIGIAIYPRISTRMQT